MATGTAGDAARQLPFQAVHYLRKRITYADRGVAVTVGKIPAGAIIVYGGVQIETAFNDSGTDVLDIGDSGNDDAYATDLDLSAVGFIALDELAATTNAISTSTKTITATYAGQNSNATAGVAHVVILYVPNNDG